MKVTLWPSPITFRAVWCLGTRPSVSWNHNSLDETVPPRFQTVAAADLTVRNVSGRWAAVAGQGLCSKGMAIVMECE
jgi:hypothetical protein